MLAAVGRLSAKGGTAIGRGILTSLGAVAGKPITLDQEALASGARQPGVRFLGSSAVVLLSDGDNTASLDPLAVAPVAAQAGVRIFADRDREPERSGGRCRRVPGCDGARPRAAARRRGPQRRHVLRRRRRRRVATGVRQDRPEADGLRAQDRGDRDGGRRRTPVLPRRGRRCPCVGTDGWSDDAPPVAVGAARPGHSARVDRRVPVGPAPTSQVRGDLRQSLADPRRATRAFAVAAEDSRPRCSWRRS